MIKKVDGRYKYYDKNLTEITEGCVVRYPDGQAKIVYATTNGELGTDATNPSWIESGKAAPCEYGIYPFDANETGLVEVIGG